MCCNCFLFFFFRRALFYASKKSIRVYLKTVAIKFFCILQVPFENAVKSVMEQLKKIAEGDYVPTSTEKRRLGAIVYAGVSLPITEIHGLLSDVSDPGPSKIFIFS